MAQNNDRTAVQIGHEDHVTHPCWSCGDMRAAQFCTSCGRVQPAAPTDYFGFFGLPRKLKIDVAALEREMYTLSRKLHPDLYVRATPEEQQWSLEQTSKLNDAYRTLRDPIARTEYLLKLEGVQLEEQSKAATEQARATGELKKQVVPPDLLEEVFELNMQLEEMKANKKLGDDDPNLARDLEKAKAGFETKLNAIGDELEVQWAEWDALIDRELRGESIPDDERHRVRDKMVDVLNRRSYIRNLVRDVNTVLAE
jgi:molecular chaperone HscB